MITIAAGDLLFCDRADRATFNRQVGGPGAIVVVIQRRHAVETADVVVSQFMRDMCVAESVVIEAATHRDLLDLNLLIVRWS
jgi:radical SAM superfamily enzyme with C-terminal helix-hairpin-helix motif